LAKDTIDRLVNDLVESDLSLVEIAIKYNLSRATVSRINAGKTHSSDIHNYPLREKILTKNDVAFIKKMSHEGMDNRPMQLVMGKVRLNSIYNISSGKTHANIKYTDYKPDKNLDDRLKTLKLMQEPASEMFNRFTDELVHEDFVYIKFLARHGTNIVEVLWAALEIINTDFNEEDMGLKSREDILKYMEWGGKKSPKMYWIIRNYHNLSKTLNGETIYYQDINLSKLRMCHLELDTEIVKSIMTCESKDGFIRKIWLWRYILLY